MSKFDIRFTPVSLQRLRDLEILRGTNLISLFVVKKSPLMLCSPSPEKFLPRNRVPFLKIFSYPGVEVNFVYINAKHQINILVRNLVFSSLY